MAQWGWESRGLCIVAPFVQTQGMVQPLLSDRVLMLVIMVVTVKVPAVGGESWALESEFQDLSPISCLTLSRLLN